MVEKYPHESYAVADRAIKSGWIFLQHVAKDTRQEFTGLGKVVQENFSPRLFFGRLKTLPPVVGDLSKFLVKKSGLGLQNPVTSSIDKYKISLCESCNLIGTFTGKRVFSTADHIWAVKEERQDGGKSGCRE